MLRSYGRNRLALVNVLNEFRYKRVGESDAELCEVFSGGGQVVSKVGHGIFQVHDDLRDVGALVSHVVEVQPGYLGHGLKGWLTRQLQVLDKQLDAVADDFVEQVLFWSHVYLVCEAWGYLGRRKYGLKSFV